MLHFPLVVDGKEVQAHLHFHHVLRPKKSRKTVCSLILQNENEETVKDFVITVRCNKKDQFARPVGRFVALANLIEKVDESLSPLVGDEIVKQYNSSVNPYWTYSNETLDRLFTQGVL